MNMQQIRKKAKAMQIIPGSRDKTTLIRAMQQREGNIPCFRTNIADCDQLICCWRSSCMPNSAPSD